MELWDKTVRSLQTSVEPYDFVHWIRPIRCEEVDDEGCEIVLSVPDDSHGRWLQEHFLGDIRGVLRDLTSHDFRVRFRSPESRPETRQSTLDLAPADAPRPPAPRPDLVGRYRFDTFVDGPNSRFALNAARAVAESPGTRYNPLFVYGGVGLGKTHLLHAVGHAVLEADPAARVLYVTSELFVNDLIGSIRTDRMDAFRARYRDACDVLLVDDIQFIAGKDRTQEEFFHLFNTLHASHKQIVVTSDQMPHAIPDLEERLRSRFQWGLLVDVKPPDFETRVAILQEKAEADRFALPEDVGMFLARHITRNVRELEGALMRLEATTRVLGRPLTVDLAREVLGEVVDGSRSRTSPESILEATARAFDVTVADLKGPRRQRHVMVPRQVAMLLVRELTDASLPHIGSLFGGRDHTTVLHGIRRMDELRQADPELKSRIDGLRSSLVRDR